MSRPQIVDEQYQDEPLVDWGDWSLPVRVPQAHPHRLPNGHVHGPFQAHPDSTWEQFGPYAQFMDDLHGLPDDEYDAAAEQRAYWAARYGVGYEEDLRTGAGVIAWLFVVLIAVAALVVLWILGADARASVPSAGAAVWAGAELIGRLG